MCAGRHAFAVSPRSTSHPIGRAFGFAPAVSAGLTASTPGGKFPRPAEQFTARVTIASAPADAGEAERPVARCGHK